MKKQPETLKTHKNRPATMKKQSGIVENHENQPGVVQGGYRWLHIQGTPRRNFSLQTLHHNIYIITIAR